MDQQTCSSFDGNRLETSWNEEVVVEAGQLCFVVAETAAMGQSQPGN